MRKYLIISLFFISCHSKEAVVNLIIDGDTFITSDNEKIRLYDIDAPEKTQAFGHESKAFASSYLLHKKIRIEKMDTDKYNRSVCKVFLADGTYFNELSVTRGYAQISYKFCHDKKLIEEMETARRNKIGLWTFDNEPPFIYRKHHKK